MNGRGQLPADWLRETHSCPLLTTSAGTRLADTGSDTPDKTSDDASPQDACEKNYTKIARILASFSYIVAIYV